MHRVVVGSSHKSVHDARCLEHYATAVGSLVQETKFSRIFQFTDLYFFFGPLHVAKGLVVRRVRGSSLSYTRKREPGNFGLRGVAAAHRRRRNSFKDYRYPLWRQRPSILGAHEGHHSRRRRRREREREHSSGAALECIPSAPVRPCVPQAPNKL